MRFFIVRGRRVMAFEERVQARSPEEASAVIPNGVLEATVQESDASWREPEQGRAAVVVLGDQVAMPRDLAAELSMSFAERAQEQEQGRHRAAELEGQLAASRAAVLELEAKLAASR